MLQAQVRTPQPVQLRQRGVGLSRGTVHISAVLLLLIADTAMAIFAFFLAYRLRFDTDLIPIQHLTSWEQYSQMMVVTVVTLLATLALRGQYALRRGVSRVDLAWSIAGG